MNLLFKKFRRFLGVSLALGLMAGVLHAAPYGTNGMVTEWTQPDGTKVALRVFGDEFYGRTESLEGYTVTFDPATKTYHYATLSPDGNEFTSTGKIVGKGDPNALGLKKHLEINPASRDAKVRKNYQAHEAVVKQEERWEAVKAASRNYESFKNEVKKQEKAGKKSFVIPMGTIFPDSQIPPAPAMAPAAEGDGGGSKEPTVEMIPPSFTMTGDILGLTILIDFSDAPGTAVTPAQIDDYCNKPNYTGGGNSASVHDYFFIQSGGKLRYNNTVTYYVRVPQPKSYYNNTSQQCGLCGRLLLNDALTVLIASGFDFSKLSVKSDGTVRACNVFIAGGDSGVWSMGLWPHRWVLGTSRNVGGGRYINDYQLTTIGSSSNVPIGTFCHENGHMLMGFVDLYSANYSAANVGTFSLMAYGADAGQGFHPTNVDPYLKRGSGWMDVVDLASTSNQRCTLQVDNNQIYRYRNPSNPIEYFMFELRDDTGYEAAYGGSPSNVNPTVGLVAYHLLENGSNTNSSIFAADSPNCSYTRPYELLLVEAFPQLVRTPWYDAPSPGGSDGFSLSIGKTAISDTTTPVDLKFWVQTQSGGRLTNSGCNINNISADSNVMTFIAGSSPLSTTPGITLSRATLTARCNFGANATSQWFAVGNSQNGTLNYTVSTNQPWLSCNTTTGSLTTGTKIITVNYSSSGLAPGTYTGTITVTAPAATPTTQTISVSLTVTAQAVMTISTTAIAATGVKTLPGPQVSFQIRNAGGGSMTYTTSKTQSWLSLSRASGTVASESDAIFVNFDATLLTVLGTYTDTITVTSGLANDPPQTIAVTFTVGSAEMIVASPNGGESWNKGETRPITWVSNLGGNVRIELFKSGILNATLAASTPNNELFNWAIPGAQAQGADYSVKITSVENPVKTDASNASFTIMPTLADAVDTSGLTWTTSGNQLWFPQTATSKDGVDAAKSGRIYINQTSSMQTTLTGPGTLTYWWQVSSAINYDFLRFYINGVEQTGSLARISGKVGWIQKTASIPAGTQTLKWSYTKASSSGPADEGGWLDQVVWTPAIGPEIAVEQPVGTNLVDGSASVFCGSAMPGSPATAVTLTIKNLGDYNLTGLTLSKGGTHSVDFALGALGAVSLAPGASTTFTVTFTPSAVGTRTATIQIGSNDFNENPFDINLTGTAVTAYTVTFDPNGGAAPSPTSKSVGYGLPYGNLATTTRTGYNFNGWFTAISGGTQVTSETTVTTTANQTLYAQWTAQAPEIAVEPTVDTNLVDGSGTVHCGSAMLGSPAAAVTLTIKNLGDATLTGLSLSKGGANSADFALGALGAVSVAPGASTTFTVTFTPSAGGPRAASIQIASNDSDENPFDILLTGTGVTTYTVNFDSNGGVTPSPTSKSVTYDSTYGTLATTSRTAYTFNGWFTAISGGTQVTSGTPVTITADQTLYAQWTAHAPEIDVTRGANPIADSGYNAVHGTSASTGFPLTFNIANTGQISLTLATAVKSAVSNCSVVINTQPSSSVAASTSSNLLVTVTPTAAGAWSFNLSIANNDSDENPYNWTVHGVTGVSVIRSFQKGVNPDSNYTNVHDTYINDASPATNYGGDSFPTIVLATKKAGNPKYLRYGMIRFDLASIPNNVTVTSASLDFSSGGIGTGDLTIAEVTGSTTWLETEPTWNNSNTRIGSAQYGSAIIPSGAAGTTVPNVTLDAAGISLINSWIESPTANYGFSLTTATTTDISLCSSNHTTPAYRPRLNLTYIDSPQVPEMHVTHADAGIADSGTDSIPGMVPGVGTQLTYTIANLGSTNLTLTTPVTATATSNCSIAVNTQPSSPVVASTATPLLLTVTPTAAGTWSATVAIANNDSDENPYNWTISGTTANVYAVTFDRQGGTGGSASVSVAYGAAMPAATAPTRTGYLFGGYYTAINGSGTQYYTNTMASARNWDLTAATTLYARWLPKTTPTITTWPSATPIMVGQALSAASLNGGSASVPGSFAYNSPSYLPAVGTYPAAVTFTPTDSDNYLTVAGLVNVTVQASFNSFISDPIYGLSLETQGFNDDPDGDGLKNGLEAYFGTHPGQFSRGLAAPTTNGTTTTFTHPCNANLPANLGISYHWSPNLMNWYVGDGVAGPAEGQKCTITHGTANGTTTVTAVSTAPQQRLFLRAVVTKLSE